MRLQIRFQTQQQQQHHGKLPSFVVPHQQKNHQFRYSTVGRVDATQWDAIDIYDTRRRNEMALGIMK